MGRRSDRNALRRIMDRARYRWETSRRKRWKRDSRVGEEEMKMEVRQCRGH